MRNACAQFNAGVEKRREKAWTNFTRDLRHRRHKCLTCNSVTNSVLAMRVYMQLETSSQRISSLSGRRERAESRAGNSTGTVQSYGTRSRWRGIAWHVMTMPQTQVVRSLTAPGKPVLEFYLLFLAVVSSHFVLMPTSWQTRLVYTCTVG